MPRNRGDASDFPAKSLKNNTLRRSSFPDPQSPYQNPIKQRVKGTTHPPTAQAASRAGLAAQQNPKNRSCACLLFTGPSAVVTTR